MLLELITAIAMAQAQDDAKAKKTAPGDDDLVVAGLPEGEIRPLPHRVKWDLKPAAKTAKRERFNLQGYWRFAAIDESETTVKRENMGWIEMPSPPADDGANVFDHQFRNSDGLWRGKPLDKFPILWSERDIRVTNADTLDWLSRRVYVIVRGPWANAELFTSQRLTKRRNELADDPEPVHVHVEPVEGVERDGGRMFDITEQLIYPGSTQISLRLNRSKSDENGPDRAMPEPYLALERWPTGCRVDSIVLSRHPDSSAVQAIFHLERPQNYMILGMPPVRTIPLSIKLRLESAESKEEIANAKHDIMPLAEVKRPETITIPWPDGIRAESKVRLHVQLTTRDGVLFDEAWPVEFRYADLKAADH